MHVSSTTSSPAVAWRTGSRLPSRMETCPQCHATPGSGFNGPTSRRRPRRIGPEAPRIIGIGQLPTVHFGFASRRQSERPQSESGRGRSRSVRSFVGRSRLGSGASCDSATFRRPECRRCHSWWSRRARRPPTRPRNQAANRAPTATRLRSATNRNPASVIAANMRRSGERSAARSCRRSFGRHRRSFAGRCHSGPPSSRTSRCRWLT